MSGERPIAMTERDARELGDIIKALKNVRGGGGIEVQLVPGKGLMINLKRKGQHRTAEYAQPFLAKITGNVVLIHMEEPEGGGDPVETELPNRWAYAWTEVVVEDDVVKDKTNGRSGTTTEDYALNLVEMYHTSKYAFGVEVDGDDEVDGNDYPDDFAPMPIGGGGTTLTHKYNVIVVMHAMIDDDGKRRYVFNLMGSHDGTC